MDVSTGKLKWSRLATLMAGVALVVVVASVFIVRNPVRIPQMSADDKANWRMPALALLQSPRWSLGRRVALVAMQAYLGVAVLLLIVKAVQLALAHH